MKYKRKRSEHIKGSEERYVLGQKTTCEMSMVIPFIKLQKRHIFPKQLNGEKI